MCLALTIDMCASSRASLCGKQKRRKKLALVLCTQHRQLGYEARRSGGAQVNLEHVSILTARQSTGGSRARALVLSRTTLQPLSRLCGSKQKRKHGNCMLQLSISGFLKLRSAVSDNRDRNNRVDVTAPAQWLSVSY